MQAERLSTPEEYLEIDAEAEVRHEYWHGRVVAMAGETYEHNAVKDDLVDALRRRMACDVLSSGLRVRAPGYGREAYAYPDVLVMCAPKQFDETTRPPTLLIEVASDSTRSRDFSDKLDAYFRLESLREYWIVEVEHPRVTRYERSEGGILVHMIRGLEQRLESAAFNLEIPLQEIYRRVLP